MSASDQILLKQWISERDAYAFRHLTLKHSSMVYGTCLRILWNTSDAEDVTQECFMILAGTTRIPQGSLGAWLHQIATYQSLNHRRSAQRRRAREQNYSKAKAVSVETKWDDVSPFIDEVISVLSEKQRIAILSHYMEEQSITSIAKREGVSQSAISQRIHQGVSVIRQGLNQRGITVGSTALLSMLAPNSMAGSICSPGLTQALSQLRVPEGAVGASPSGIQSMLSIKGVVAAISAAAILVIAGLVVMSGSESQPVAALPLADLIDVDIANDPTLKILVPKSIEAKSESPSVEENSNSLASEEYEPNDQPLSWQDVVQKYETHQNKIRSITVNYENYETGKGFSDSLGKWSREQGAYQAGTFTTDGKRCYIEQRCWGQAHWDTFSSQARHDLHTCAWNGEVQIEYHEGGGFYYGEPGTAQIHYSISGTRIPIVKSLFPNGPSYLFMRSSNELMFGFAMGTTVHIEKLINEAKQVSLRDERENVNGADCYVIDANTRFGYFSIWFDPGHDFNIAKFSRLTVSGELYNSKVLYEGWDSVEWEYTAKRFQKVDGLWVPRESNSLYLSQGPNGVYQESRYHHIRTAITLNPPDANKDSTYALNGTLIRNGSRWNEFRAGKLTNQENEIWQDGAIVYQSDDERKESRTKKRNPDRVFGRGASQ